MATPTSRSTTSSGFDIFIERIDVTKNKEGRIQITDTSTGVGSAADPFERVEYTFSEGQVREQHYEGTLTPPNADGLITVNYAAVGTATGVDIDADDHEFEYNPVAGSQYFWVEGQEKTQTEVKYYKKNEFNLTGGLVSWIDDNLVGDESYKWRTFAFTDERPLLESEGIIVDPATTDVAYSVEYKTRETFANEPIADNWTTGGGWLQTKSYHKLVTTVSGVKDFYTHTLEADRSIKIDFVAGPSAPSVSITSGGLDRFRRDQRAGHGGLVGQHHDDLGRREYPAEHLRRHLRHQRRDDHFERIAARQHRRHQAAGDERLQPAFGGIKHADR